jgi:hypothetical protein
VAISDMAANAGFPREQRGSGGTSRA